MNKIFPIVHHLRWQLVRVCLGTVIAIIPLAISADADKDGKALFQVHCARCHGMLGGGGEGPSLKRAKLRHAPDDETLKTIISQGLTGTGMPGNWTFTDHELSYVASYVRSLGQLPPEPLPGDPASGGRLYDLKGQCHNCHILNGRGRGVGPELSDVGLRRNAEYLRNALISPDMDQPKTSTTYRGNINSFLTVRLVSASGEFEGIRINEDEFSVQMRDLGGKSYSFDKQSLTSYQKAFGHSLMPSYETTFTSTEVDDLVSYLMNLKGPE